MRDCASGNMPGVAKSAPDVCEKNARGVRKYAKGLLAHAWAKETQTSRMQNLGDDLGKYARGLRKHAWGKKATIRRLRECAKDFRKLNIRSGL